MNVVVIALAMEYVAGCVFVK